MELLISNPAGGGGQNNTSNGPARHSLPGIENRTALAIILLLADSFVVKFDMKF